MSRRWDLLRPLIAEVLAEFAPRPEQVVGQGTVLVDGTVWHEQDERGVSIVLHHAVPGRMRARYPAHG